MKSRINGVLVFFFATIIGIILFFILSQDSIYVRHYWMMSPFWMMGLGGLIIAAGVGLVVYILMRYPLKQPSNAYEILQQRLINGDISEEEYNHLKNILHEE